METSILLYYLASPFILGFSTLLLWLLDREHKFAKKNGKIKHVLYGWTISDKKTTPESFSLLVFWNRLFSYFFMGMIGIVMISYILAVVILIVAFFRSQ